MGCAGIAVGLAVLVGNKELIVVELYYWQKNDPAGFCLNTRHTSQGMALLSFYAFSLDFYGELKTNKL